MKSRVGKKGTKWTQEEVDFLIKFWRTNNALGTNNQDMADFLAEKFGRTRASVLGKADLLKLTRRAAKVAEQYST